MVLEMLVLVDQMDNLEIHLMVLLVDYMVEEGVVQMEILGLLKLVEMAHKVL